MIKNLGEMIWTHAHLGEEIENRINEGIATIDRHLWMVGGVPYYDAEEMPTEIIIDSFAAGLDGVITLYWSPRRSRRLSEYADDNTFTILESYFNDPELAREQAEVARAKREKEKLQERLLVKKQDDEARVRFLEEERKEEQETLERLLAKRERGEI